MPLQWTDDFRDLQTNNLNVLIWLTLAHISPGFTLLHLIATGVSCFLGAGLLSFLVYVYSQRFHKPSQESAVIHPTTPNHLSYKGNTTPKNEKYTPMEFKVRASIFYVKCSSYNNSSSIPEISWLTVLNIRLKKTDRAISIRNNI